MLETISLYLFLAGLLGMAVIFLRQVPYLTNLAETPESFSSEKISGRIKKSIKNIFFPKGFPSDLFLQKILSKIRVLTLKTDHKTSSLLQRLREKSQKNKFGENDDYWQKVKDLGEKDKD